MAPQVGLEPHPEIPTAETIVLKFLKNTGKTSTDAGFDDVPDLPQQTQKTSQIAGRQYKNSTFFRGEVLLYGCAERIMRKIDNAFSGCESQFTVTPPQHRLHVLRSRRDPSRSGLPGCQF